MKFIGLLSDYNPQAQYREHPDNRKERLIAGFTHTFSSADLLGLIKRALEEGIIQAPDLPLSARAMLEAAQHKAFKNPLEGAGLYDLLSQINTPKHAGPFKVVIDGDHLPSRNYITLEAAKDAALKSAERNGKSTMVVSDHARFTIKKEVVEEN